MTLDFAQGGIAGLHFLRPWWLLALPAVAWAAWRWRRRRAAGAWERFVDPALRAHVLAAVPAHRGGGWAAWLAASLAVLALAGPAWRQDPQPLWDTQAPLVVALDLSQRMLADDLPPSRLARARAKLAALLEARRGGEVGLLAYADGAYTVVPLTRDPANVAVFLEALSPEAMPGERGAADAAEAIARASAMLRNAGFARGDILLLSGGALGADAAVAAAQAAASGHRVSVLAVAPAGDPGGAGAVAAAGGGRSVALRADDGDLAALGVLDTGGQGAQASGREGAAGWRDEGYWLLLPALLLAAFAFRRNGAVAMLALCLLWPWRPAAAGDVDWWRRADQRAHQRMEAGAQAYRAGDHAAALRAWDGLPGADAAYNRGNALARQGRYAEAIAAYDAALRQRPGMADAIANRKAVEEAMQRQPPQGEGDREDAGRKGDEAQGRDADQARRAGESDAARADAAEQARRERERAARARDGDAGTPQDAGMREGKDEDAGERERRLANQAKLQRVPDDPGGLLRARLRLEYERRRRGGG